jgi:hypothetical protein
MAEDMGKGNPDAAQDETLITSVMERTLGPIFEAIGSRLKDLEEDLGENRDLLYKLSEGIIGAADEHKRTTLTGEISSKYGKDIEPFEGFYKDTQGKGFTDAILEELMGDGAPDETGRDEWMKNKLGEARKKYGKYVGIKDEEEVPIEKPAEGEQPMEEKAEAPEEKQAEEKTGEEPADAVSGLMNQLKAVGGEKHSLSSKRK